METFGECSLVLNGRQYIARGEAEITATGLVAAVEANVDGSVYKTVKTAACTIKINLEDEIAAPITTADLLRSHEVSFREEHRGVVHNFTNAEIVGEPKLDPATGALSEISFSCSRANYRRVGE